MSWIGAQLLQNWEISKISIVMKTLDDQSRYSQWRKDDRIKSEYLASVNPQ